MSNNDKDVKQYHNYEDRKVEKYDDVVKGWHQYTKEMREKTSEDRIMRWSYNNGMYKYFDNPGKVITDNNPYINLVDIEEFDQFILNQPFSLKKWSFL